MHSAGFKFVKLIKLKIKFFESSGTFYWISNITDYFCRENDPSWAAEIQDDVIEECNKHGGIVHIYVDKNSPQVSRRLKRDSFNITELVLQHFFLNAQAVKLISLLLT